MEDKRADVELMVIVLVVVGSCHTCFNFAAEAQKVLPGSLQGFI